METFPPPKSRAAASVIGRIKDAFRLLRGRGNFFLGKVGHTCVGVEAEGGVNFCFRSFPRDANWLKETICDRKLSVLIYRVYLFDIFSFPKFSHAELIFFLL